MRGAHCKLSAMSASSCQQLPAAQDWPGLMTRPATGGEARTILWLNYG